MNNKMKIILIILLLFSCSSQVIRWKTTVILKDTNNFQYLTDLENFLDYALDDKQREKAILETKSNQIYITYPIFKDSGSWSVDNE